MQQNKKRYFYLDTSGSVNLGLLDESLSWIDFKGLNNKKASQILHGEIYSLLKTHQLEIDDIDSFIVCTGPGSYTGVRLSQGFIQTLCWQKKNVSNFYLFEVPYFCGVQHGYFLCEAYKGEVFVYEWNHEQSSKKLIQQKELKEIDFTLEHIYHPQGEIQGHEVFDIESLIRTKPKMIFENILKRQKVYEPFYFRPIDKEFQLKEKKR